jgi:DNA-binding IscR family transcriptional regulator
MDRPCNPDEPCVAHDRWKRIAAETRDFFDQTTVAELLEGADAGAFRI